MPQVTLMISSSGRGLNALSDKCQGCVLGMVVGLRRKLSKALASASDNGILGRRFSPWRRRVQALLFQNLVS
jgi:hypothetical protein